MASPHDQDYLRDVILPDLGRVARSVYEQRGIIQTAQDRAPVSLAVGSGGLDAAKEALRAREEELNRALRALRELEEHGTGAALTGEDVDALKLMSCYVQRPSLPIVQHQITSHSIYWDPPSPGVFSEVAMGVGRLDRDDGKERHHTGTGVLIGDALALTNNHVVAMLAGCTKEEIEAHHQGWSGAWFADWIQRFNAVARDGAGVCFDIRCESGTDLVQSSRVTKVYRAHDRLDAALLALEALPPGSKPVPLRAVEPQALVNRYFWTMGYPAVDTSSLANRAVIELLFAADKPTRGPQPASTGIKRAAPGRVMSCAGDDLITHDASTLGGCSGSPLFGTTDLTMFALHRAGTWFTSNEAIPVSALVDGKLFLDLDRVVGL